MIVAITLISQILHACACAQQARICPCQHTSCIQPNLLVCVMMAPLLKSASPRYAATWWACVSTTGLHGAWLFAMHNPGRSGGMPPCLNSAAVSCVPPINVLDLREDDLQGAHEEDLGRLREVAGGVWVV